MLLMPHRSRRTRSPWRHSLSAAILLAISWPCFAANLFLSGSGCGAAALPAPLSPFASTEAPDWRDRLSARPAPCAATADDVAVIVGNGNYAISGGLPDVSPSHGDSVAVFGYVTTALGIRADNVILIADATHAELAEVFGNLHDHRGRLFDWVKPGLSRVFVYYVGHGIPGGAHRDEPMLVPVDASAPMAWLSGYPLRTLFDNLGRLPSHDVTLVLDTGFSGYFPGGSVLGGPRFTRSVEMPSVPPNLTVITATTGDQIAEWEPDGRRSLFTDYFLDGAAGLGNRLRVCNEGRGATWEQLRDFLDATLPRRVEQEFGRSQNSQIIQGSPSAPVTTPAVH